RHRIPGRFDALPSALGGGLSGVGGQRFIPALGRAGTSALKRRTPQAGSPPGDGKKSTRPGISRLRSAAVRRRWARSSTAPPRRAGGGRRRVARGGGTSG